MTESAMVGCTGAAESRCILFFYFLFPFLAWQSWRRGAAADGGGWGCEVNYCNYSEITCELG